MCYLDDDKWCNDMWFGERAIDNVYTMMCVWLKL